jgi:hypothetical protein
MTRKPTRRNAWIYPTQCNAARAVRIASRRVGGLTSGAPSDELDDAMTEPFSQADRCGGTFRNLLRSPVVTIGSSWQLSSNETAGHPVSLTKTLSDR